MKAEGITTFSDASNLIEWMKSNSIDLDITDKEATIIIDYLDGHGYKLGFIDNKMIRIDLRNGSDELEAEEYSINDAVLAISDWNSLLIEHVQKELNESYADEEYKRNIIRYADYMQDDQIINDLSKKINQKSIIKENEIDKMTSLFNEVKNIGFKELEMDRYVNVGIVKTDQLKNMHLDFGDKIVYSIDAANDSIIINQYYSSLYVGNLSSDDFKKNIEYDKNIIKDIMQLQEKDSIHIMNETMDLVNALVSDIHVFEQENISNIDIEM